MKDIAADVSVSRSFNIQILGLNFHRVIFPASFSMVLALVLLALNDPAAFGQALEGLKGWILKNGDWFIMIMGNLAVLFCAGLALLPFGKIRLGGKHAGAARLTFGLPPARRGRLDCLPLSDR